MASILFTLIINAYPLLLFLIPWIILILKKSPYRLIYSRFYTGLIIFFLVYWVLPSIYQNIPAETPADPNTENFGHGILFMTIRAFSLLGLYLQYPFILLPFIFVLSPIISLFILFTRLRKESSATGINKWDLLSYEFHQSPKEMILSAIKRSDWKKEIEILKGFLVLLPITLYLLTVVLDLADLTAVNLSESESALGWFIEILFVYIATFLFGYQLIKSSKISFNGRFIGEPIQSRFYGSLTQVGTPIAILSTLLFIAQKQESLSLILYFFAYFLMAAYIFILFLRIFEPFSIFIFFKLVEWWKSKKEKQYSIKASTVLYTFLYSTLATLLVVLITVGVMWFSGVLTNFVPGGDAYEFQSLIGSNPTFKLIQLTELLVVINSFQFILIPMMLAFFLKRLLRMNLRNKMPLYLYAGFLLLYTLIFSLTQELFVLPLQLNSNDYWVNGKPILITLFGQEIYSMRTAFLMAEFQNNWILFVLATPFNFLRAITNFILWGIILIYMPKKIISREKEQIGQVKTIENTTYLQITHRDSMNQGLKDPQTFLTSVQSISEKAEVINGQFGTESDALSEDFQHLLQDLLKNQGLTIQEIESRYALNDKKFLQQVISGTKQGYIQWWIPEFTYTYEKAILDGLYLLYQDGRLLLFHNFRKDQQPFVEPELVSGMFCAITSFIQETTRTKTKVAAIDSGDRKVILEYSEEFPVFVALFADRENAAVRQALKSFLHAFTKNHINHLPNWSGDASLFYKDKNLVNKHFSTYM